MKKLDVQGSVLVVVYPGAPGMVSGFDKWSKMELVDEANESGNSVSKRQTTLWRIKLQNYHYIR